MCGAPIPPDEQTLLPRTGGSLAHSHVVDLKQRRLLCACRPCALLFSNDASTLAYRTVPDRYLALPAVEVDWDALQIPVGLAFFFVNSALARTVSCYPSPAGATESQLSLEAWSDLVDGNPVLAEMRPDVEALLVRTTDRGAGGCYLVPIDACYALVGRLRQLWRGFDGGAEVRSLLEAFFSDLRSVSRTVSPVPAEGRR